MKTNWICRLAFVAQCTFTPSPQAGDVFKCVIAGKTLYQDKPCSGQPASQHILTIDKPPADTLETAKQQLAAWRANRIAQAAATNAAAREQEQLLIKKQAVQALQRSAKAQEDLAAAARQPVFLSPPPVIIAPYRPYPRSPRPHLPHRPPPTHQHHTLPPTSGRQTFAPATPSHLK